MTHKVNAQRNAYKQHKGSNGALIAMQDFKQVPVQGFRGWLNRHFVFPRGELAIVTDNGQKISLPTPLLGALIALFVWIAGGTLAGVWAVAQMSANVSNLTNSQIQYQSRSDAERKAMQDKIDLQQVYITDLREKVIRLESEKGRN